VDGASSSIECGISRLKCGRSDIKIDQRSESMSCSDKILKWNMVGIQGGLIATLIDKPLFISSIIIETPGYQDLRNLEIL
jgi:tRNA-specific adenosine deaminase 1